MTLKLDPCLPTMYATLNCLGSKFHLFCEPNGSLNLKVIELMYADKIRSKYVRGERQHLLRGKANRALVVYFVQVSPSLDL